MPSFWRYQENYVTRNALEKFQDFRETAPGLDVATNTVATATLIIVMIILHHCRKLNSAKQKLKQLQELVKKIQQVWFVKCKTRGVNTTWLYRGALASLLGTILRQKLRGSVFHFFIYLSVIVTENSREKNYRQVYGKIENAVGQLL